MLYTCWSEKTSIEDPSIARHPLITGNEDRGENNERGRQGKRLMKGGMFKGGMRII